MHLKKIQKQKKQKKKQKNNQEVIYLTNKKKPSRTCMACNMQREKQDLLRIVKSKEGLVEVDITGKKMAEELTFVNQKIA